MSEDHYDDEHADGNGGGLRHPMAQRFRGYLPVVVDVETGGFNCATDALLEIAATTIGMDEKGFVFPDHTYFFRVEPFAGANIEQAALDFTGIKLDHPLRMAFTDPVEGELSPIPVRSYFETAPLRWRYPGTGATLRSYSRPVGDWLALVQDAGLRVTQLLEPPLPSSLADELFAEDDSLAPLRLIPHTLIVAAIA